MGLTIVHKSDLTARKRNPRVALVLAGGAVTGGAYKLGGLKALDDFMVNRKTTDFDIYVGLSAGSFLAAPLAGGVTPVEMLKSLDGSSADFTQLRPTDFNADPERVAKGSAKAAETLCTMCHGGGFKGQNEIPRVAGQQHDYIVKQLGDFKAGRRTNDAGNMASVSKTLSDEDIENLAQYLTTLR